MAERTLHHTVMLHSAARSSLPTPAALADANAAATGLLTDSLGRPLRDLRISVTDRCNFRCSYCMPKAVFQTDHPYLPHSALLTFEEITAITRQFVAHGVQKIRLTGGEPLLRKNLEVLIEQLARLRTPQNLPMDLTLTTNGSLLTRKAQALKAAGLQRLTVSLDGLDDTVFRAMNDVDFPVRDVLAGIDAAQRAGLGPIKVNMVIKRGVNEDQVLPMARHFKGSGITVRFIEFMDVGHSNGWRMNDVVPSAHLLERLRAALPLIALPAQSAGETAQRWGYANAEGQHDTLAGEIGFISSVSQAFCAECNRARLSTEGQLYLCLFANQGYDLRQIVRSGNPAADNERALSVALRAIWQRRQDRYSALRGQAPAAQETRDSTAQKRIEMSYIGG